MKTTVLVFAKAPIKGKVKTRLGKTIGMKASCWVYEKLLKHTFKILDKSKLPYVLFENQTDATLHAIFNSSKSNRIQEGDHLGNKMENAFHWAFDQGYEKVLLIGTDLWSLHEDTLIEAKQALDQNDFVIGPSYDGGYYLLGMNQMNPKIFKDVSWSTSQVFKDTLLNIRESSIYFLDIANDIDDFEDLKAQPPLFNHFQKHF
jgi:rSAM/selenodomain-associated transferase 1